MIVLFLVYFRLILLKVFQILYCGKFLKSKTLEKIMINLISYYNILYIIFFLVPLNVVVLLYVVTALYIILFSVWL